jgi:hypothetical protein
MPTSHLQVSVIRTDGGTQPRAEIDQAVVAEYSEHMSEGDQFPPIDVFFDGAAYWLGDGFHRLLATKQVGYAEIDAVIHEGSKRDAILYSVGANASHGLRRSNADKRRSVLTLLGDPEWVKWSDREIARRCGVSHPFVSELRPAVSGNGCQMDRTVKRGDSVYTVTIKPEKLRERWTPEPNMPVTSSDEPEPQSTRSAHVVNKLGKEDMTGLVLTDAAFKEAWEALFREMRNAKAKKWATVSKSTAAHHIQILLDFIER